MLRIEKGAEKAAEELPKCDHLFSIYPDFVVKMLSLSRFLHMYIVQTLNVMIQMLQEIRTKHSLWLDWCVKMYCT